MSEGWLGFEADFVHLGKAFSLLVKPSGIYFKLHCSRFQIYVSICGEVLYWYWDILQNWSRRACQRVQPFSCRKKTNHSRWIAFFFSFFLYCIFFCCLKDFAWYVPSACPSLPPQHTPAPLLVSGCGVGLHQVKWGHLSSLLGLM